MRRLAGILHDAGVPLSTKNGRATKRVTDILEFAPKYMHQALSSGASTAKPFDQLYRDANGLITMCMYCRRTRRCLPSPDRWDYVEAYATLAPARTSHGICKACLESVETRGVETLTTLAGGARKNLFVNRIKDKVLQLPVYPIAKTHSRRDVPSIKSTIQSLANQFWFEKRKWRSDVDWLIDGRLMDQLDALSRDQLLRVKDLLTWRAAGDPFDGRQLTKSPV